jgi:hypothetical protein
VPASQTLLFPDPRPLVERLGHDFFRELTERPGVYLMQDATGLLLNVGKAKNLRIRLGSYRVCMGERVIRERRLARRGTDASILSVCPSTSVGLPPCSPVCSAGGSSISGGRRLWGWGETIAGSKGTFVHGHVFSCAATQ